MTTYADRPPAVDALTADGAIVAIRPLTPADLDQVEELFARASGASLRRRFFINPAGPLLAAEVERLTRPPSARQLTLGAEFADQLVGVASYQRHYQTEPRAEFAVFVDDAHQGRGVGTLLLEHLARQARAEGISELYGEMLSGNVQMLRLASEVTGVTGYRERDGVVEVSLSTAVNEVALAAVDARDRTAGRASLRPLLAPMSVAVVGAGRSHGIGHEVLTGLVAYEFTGPVYPVNRRAKGTAAAPPFTPPGDPHRVGGRLLSEGDGARGDGQTGGEPGGLPEPEFTAVAGVPAYPSLTALPGPAELVVIAVPAPQVVGVLEEAASAGARAAVVLSAGFAEMGAEGQANQAELLRVARQHGIRVVGPNCLGVINTDPRVRLDASFSPTPLRSGGLAVASQSGAVGIAVLDHLGRAGCGVSSFVSLGNKVDVSGNDLISYWYDDSATRAVALYLESFGNPRRFARVARALARRKPLLAVFSGRSVAGQRAGASHTAAAAASGVAVDTLFAQAGVVRADNLGELVDAALMLTDQPLPTGRRLGVLGNAGGANVLAADTAEAHHLELPAHVGALVNPLDLGAGATPEALTRALSTMAGSGEVDAILVMLTATRANVPPALWRAVAEVADQHPQLPIAGVALGPGAPQVLGARRAPVFELPERAVRAIGHAAQYAEWRREPLGSRPELPDVDQVTARSAVREALAAGEGWQPYDRIGRILSAYQIPLLPSQTAHHAEQAVAAAERLGYPVVLKAADPELVHKTDLGAVVLRLGDAEAVRAGYRQIATALGQSTPPVLVQPMASGTVELVTGIVHDPLFGSLVMVGLGGVHTDLLGDRAFRLVPMTDLDAGRMWRSLRSAPLLTGYRNTPQVDTAAVEDLLLRLGRLAEELPEVAELDLNPILVGPDGVVAVDAKLRLAPAGPEPDPALRRLR